MICPPWCPGIAGRDLLRIVDSNGLIRNLRRPESRDQFAAALIDLHAYAVFATRPFPSTYQRSLAKGLPERRALIQSATSTEGVGPRLADGAPPTEWRESGYTT